jgi:hypothetical protein
VNRIIHFDGTLASWPLWRERFSAILRKSKSIATTLIESIDLHLAESKKTEVKTDDLLGYEDAAALKYASRTLWDELILAVSGDAELTVRAQPRYDGIACWLALIRKYESSTLLEYTQTLIELVNLKMDTTASAYFDRADILRKKLQLLSSTKTQQPDQDMIAYTIIQSTHCRTNGSIRWHSSTQRQPKKHSRGDNSNRN